jgi:hypothetical protein
MVGLGKTRILSDHAQNSPWTLRPASIHEVWLLEAVYTMDHEVIPRKRPILRGTISWDDFHGPSY